MTTAIPLIRPISDLRTNLNAVCDEAQSTQQPIFMTKNGKSCLVIMDSEAYERAQQHDRDYLKLREAEIEARYQPESVPLKDVLANAQHIIDIAKETSDEQR